ncbi:hypothetical protein [Bradyrhizobium sp. LMG 9283]|uniref:hypothetical protein n=1 Tax=Bradyrhizobium sp. LMG 9283 TaxID=592064 RepID=UPI0038908713
MSYAEEWDALANRIRSLGEVARLFAQFAASNASDTYGIAKDLGDQCEAILREIASFESVHHSTLPKEALDCLNRFLNGHPAKVIGTKGSSREVKASISFLLSFESELTYALKGKQELLRSKTERAFLHLQRTLAVDKQHQQKWKDAFASTRGEEACEKLGAVHLLWHGIYPFKAGAAGATTDLIYQEPIDTSIGRRGIDGLVLTEWKVADEKTAQTRFREARDQAQLYKGGLLAGLELAQYRYVVVVTLLDLPKALIPDDVRIGDVIYRHINVAIEPRYPSQQARATTKKS